MVSVRTLFCKFLLLFFMFINMETQQTFALGGALGDIYSAAYSRKPGKIFWGFTGNKILSLNAQHAWASLRENLDRWALDNLQRGSNPANWFSRIINWWHGGTASIPSYAQKIYELRQQKREWLGVTKAFSHLQENSRAVYNYIWNNTGFFSAPNYLKRIVANGGPQTPDEKSVAFSTLKLIANANNQFREDIYAAHRRILTEHEIGQLYPGCVDNAATVSTLQSQLNPPWWFRIQQSSLLRPVYNYFRHPCWTWNLLYEKFPGITKLAAPAATLGSMYALWHLYKWAWPQHQTPAPIGAAPIVAVGPGAFAIGGAAPPATQPSTWKRKALFCAAAVALCPLIVGPCSKLAGFASRLLQNYGY